MNVLLLDTNVVSILFNRNHGLRQNYVDVVTGHQLVVSFMTLAELLLCAVRSQVVDQCRRAGRSIQTADAWIASAALQWSCPPATTDFRDYAAMNTSSYPAAPPLRLISMLNRLIF